MDKQSTKEHLDEIVIKSCDASKIKEVTSILGSGKIVIDLTECPQQGEIDGNLSPQLPAPSYPTRATQSYFIS